MRHLMFVRVDPEPERWMPDQGDDVAQRIARIAGHRLEGVEDTLTVRRGEVLVTDGPFAETKEGITSVAVVD